MKKFWYKTVIIDFIYSFKYAKNNKYDKDIKNKNWFYFFNLLSILQSMFTFLNILLRAGEKWNQYQLKIQIIKWELF